GPIEPVQIFEHNYGWRAAGQRTQKKAKVANQSLVSDLSTGIGDDRAARRQAENLAENVDRLGKRLAVALCQQAGYGRAQLRADVVGCVLLADAKEVTQEIGDEPETDLLAV